MNSLVLDASAILAFLLQEPGHDKITTAMLTRAVASSVNIAEVQTRLVREGGLPDEAWADARTTIQRVVPFDENDARVTGSLVAQTKHLGLSLGDRACLSLGIALKAPIYTADRSWKKLNLGIPIHVIR